MCSTLDKNRYASCLFVRMETAGTFVCGLVKASVILDVGEC